MKKIIDAPLSRAGNHEAATAPAKRPKKAAQKGVMATWRDVRQGVITSRKKKSLLEQTLKTTKKPLTVESYAKALIDWACDRSRDTLITRDEALALMAQHDVLRRGKARAELYYKQVWQIFVLARFIRKVSDRAAKKMRTKLLPAQYLDDLQFGEASPGSEGTGCRKTAQAPFEAVPRDGKAGKDKRRPDVPLDSPHDLHLGQVRSGRKPKIRKQAEDHGLCPEMALAYAKELRRWLYGRKRPTMFISRQQAISVMMDFATKRKDGTRPYSFYVRLWGIFVLAGKVVAGPRGYIIPAYFNARERARRRTQTLRAQKTDRAAPARDTASLAKAALGRIP